MWLLDVLFPASCLLCEARGSVLCPDCIVDLPPPREVPTPAGMVRVTAGFSYEDSVRRVIQALKYRNGRGTVAFLADHLATQLPEADFDCITWMPSSRSGMRKRGYEPSRLLARQLGLRLRLPARRLLLRTDDNPQTTRSRTDRLTGPTLRPAPRASSERRVLVVDDVCTTGTSLENAVEALRVAGVDYVEGLVVASTPSRLHVG